MPPRLRSPSLILSTSSTTQLRRSAQSRSFSVTSQRDQRITVARRALFRWLNGNGQNFANPLPGSTNYLTAYNRDGQLYRVVQKEKMENEKKASNGREVEPEERNYGAEAEIPPERPADFRVFPRNPHFSSQSVLSETFREVIWERIMKEGESVRDVSAGLRVEMSRVGAVVRLKEIEKEWQRIGKPLAKPYAEAVMAMLPKTEWVEPSSEIETHESINDLPVHAATAAQIFYPTSESRHFTREDAAKIFDESLLPADKRVPHPELALQHKDFMAGMKEDEIAKRQSERDEKEEKKRAKTAGRLARKVAAVKKFQTPRWEFRFTEVNVDNIGKDGRGAKGVGWRYGAPLMDRSRGQVKIPTRVVS